MTKAIYLANPYGFSAQQRALLLPPIVTALGSLGLEVWEPFARNNQVDFQAAGWACQVGQKDFRDMAESDAIFAVVNGVPPDAGVMVELGMAIALGKPTENGYIESFTKSFDGKFRDECLNLNWFLDLADSRVMIEDWRTDYNRDRPHSSLGYLTPLEFKRDLHRNLSLTMV